MNDQQQGNSFGMGPWSGEQDRNSLHNLYPQNFSETNPHAQPYPQYMPPPAQHARTKKLPKWAWAVGIVGALVAVGAMLGQPTDPAQKANVGGGLPNVVSTPTPTPVAKPTAKATPIAPRTKEVAPAIPVNPDSVRRGQAFEVNGKRVLAGWKLNATSWGDFQITGKVQNVGQTSTIMTLVEFKFVKGFEIVGEVNCMAGDVEPGRVATMDCYSTDPFTREYDKIEVKG